MAGISVIIPVYNGERFLHKCLESLALQSYSDFECIVVNDGSFDRSEEIALAFVNKDCRYKYIKQKNSGVAVARNSGVNNACGKYLIFVDGDDYLLPDYLEKMWECAERDNLQMTLSGFHSVDPMGNVISKVMPIAYQRFVHEEWAYRMGAVCGHMYECAFWKKYKFTFEDEPGARGEDVPITIMANVWAERIGIADTDGYCYVQHKESAMHNFRGFEKYHFPFETVSIMREKINIYGIKNGREFYVMGMLKFFAMFLFDLGRGASKERMQELCDYITEYIRIDIPDMRQMMKELRKKKYNLPFSYKILISFIARFYNSTIFKRVMCIYANITHIKACKNEGNL